MRIVIFANILQLKPYVKKSQSQNCQEMLVYTLFIYSFIYLFIYFLACILDVHIASNPSMFDDFIGCALD